MRPIQINSWDEFPTAIKQIVNEFGKTKTLDDQQKNTILYRGQANAEKWHLESTLERFSSQRWTVESYASLAATCVSQVESFTDRDWHFPSREEIRASLGQQGHGLRQIPGDDFWVYLRHHGFPSPLLDWTTSAYIAAFFAFIERNDATHAAIYAYIELPEAMKENVGDEPEITVIEPPYVKTHRRHFLQQSRYTVCTKPEAGSYRFVCHEDVFNMNKPDRDVLQDVLIKITIPRCSERLKALSYLNEVNINDFSLFRSEEALVKTLAFKEFELPQA